MPKQIQFKIIIQKLQSFFIECGRLPSFSEMQELFGYQSKGGVSRLIERLEERGIIKRDRKGKLLPTPFIHKGIKLLGTVQAGFPSPAEEELIDVLSLDQFLIQKPDATYLVKVTGDSMIDAGIHAGDLVLVERGRPVKSGDIVIAQIDDEWTMKYFHKKGRHVVLKAANEKYPPMIPTKELVIGGVVTACIRKYVT